MNPRRLHIAICLGLVGLTWLAFGLVLANDFINLDDPDYVTGNSVVKSGLNWNSVGSAWTTPQAGFWIPLTWMSLELDATLFWPGSVADPHLAGSMAAWGFHLTNLLVHIANVLLAYWLMWRLTGSVGCAALIAALFGVHPLRVESVAWITERKDVLSCFFGLLALLAYLRFRDRPRVWRMLAVVLLFAMSLLAKPVLVILPALMLVLDWWKFSKPAARARESSEPDAPARVSLACASGSKESFDCASGSKIGFWTCRVLEKLPLIGLSLACTWITIQTQHTAGATSLVRLPLKLRLANAVVSYQSYLAKTFWPVDLAVFYPHPGGSLTGLHIGFASVVLIGITGLVLALRKQVPAMLVGWLWFVGGLVPNIGMIQAGGQAMADRFSYFALLGLFLALVSGADYLACRYRIALMPRITAALIVVMGCAAMTWTQVGLWKNCETLYTYTLAVTEDNGYIHELLGIYFYDHDDLDRAEEQLGKALALKTVSSPHVFLYYGTIMHRKKAWHQAVAPLETSVAMQPNLPISQYFLGDTLLHLDEGEPGSSLLARAQQHLERAIALQPSFVMAYLSLAKVQDARRNRDQARRTILHAMTLTSEGPMRAQLEEYLKSLK